MGVVPKPYTTPHPQLFQAFGASPGTLQWCGEEDVTPTILMGDRSDPASSSWRSTRRARRSAGPQPARSARASACAGRSTSIPNGTSSSEVDARIAESVRKYEEPVWRGWYEQFGFMEGARLAGEEGPVPGPDETLKERLTKSGLLIGGTVDDVKRQVESFLEELPIDYFVWLFHWGMIPPRGGAADARALRDGDHARVRDGRVRAGGGRGRRLRRCPD